MALLLQQWKEGFVSVHYSKTQSTMVEKAQELEVCGGGFVLVCARGTACTRVDLWVRRHPSVTLYLTFETESLTAPRTLNMWFNVAIALFKLISEVWSILQSPPSQHPDSGRAPMCLAFMWELRIQSQTLVLLYQAPYWLSHVASHPSTVSFLFNPGLQSVQQPTFRMSLPTPINLI